MTDYFTAAAQADAGYFPTGVTDTVDYLLKKWSEVKTIKATGDSQPVANLSATTDVNPNAANTGNPAIQPLISLTGDKLNVAGYQIDKNVALIGFASIVALLVMRT